ncbi:hypothetical protein [Mycobacterium simiae]|uniref:hypothetical protein n=1 Tax=Mycobacterium simiae TaxID=1784 RepID=UPI00165ECEC8|nr:hypothetical protein [Mycobacterium simiae]
MSHSEAHASQIAAQIAHTCAAHREPRANNVTQVAHIVAQSRHKRAHSAMFASPMQAAAQDSHAC